MCEVLKVNRSILYKKPFENIEKKECTQKIIDEIYHVKNEAPYYGYRKIHISIIEKGFMVNQKKIRALCKIMGIKVVIPLKRRKYLSTDKEYLMPYLVKKENIIKANDVWAVDITYINYKNKTLYLIAIIDIYSRKALAHRIVENMTAEACCDVLFLALKIGKPIILNSDQGSQFTSQLWTSTLSAINIQISMDGVGRFVDNIFIERLWRSAKYECFYLNDFNTIDEVVCAAEKYLNYYNQKRFHQSLNYKTPDFIYFSSINNLRSITPIPLKGIKPLPPVSTC